MLEQMLTSPGDRESILADAAPCLRQNGVQLERARNTIRRTFPAKEALDAAGKL